MYPQATHNIHVHRNYAKNTDTHLYKYILHLKKGKKFYFCIRLTRSIFSFTLVLSYLSLKYPIISHS